ncbi:MAG: hypothetical protein HKN47_11820 [Pirellulaceae bacterium]|nr:hypothetical protein [Pirellulaceae bacterium]
MTNPYQPPTESSAGNVEDSLAGAQADTVNVRYAGGRWGLVILGNAAGVAVAFALFLLDSLGTLNWVIAATAALWVICAVTMMFLLRGTQLHAAWRLLTGFLLGPMACAIYVPVCTYSSFISEEIGVARGGSASTVLVSVACFVALLLTIATIVRRICQGKERKRLAQP